MMSFPFSHSFNTFIECLPVIRHHSVRTTLKIQQLKRQARHPRIYWAELPLFSFIKEREQTHNCKKAQCVLTLGKYRGLGLSGKESSCHSRKLGFDPWIRKIPWRRKWQPTAVFLLGKSCGQRSLVGYIPWSHRGGHDLETKQQQWWKHKMGGWLWLRWGLGPSYSPG